MPAAGNLSAVVRGKGLPLIAFPLTSYKVREIKDMRVSRSLSRRDLQHEIIVHSHQPSFLWITDGHQRANGMPIDVRGEPQIEIDYAVLHVAVVTVHYFRKRQEPIHAITVGAPAEKRSGLAEAANQQPAVSRSGRQLKLSQRAREALDEREETDIEVDPLMSHYRKTEEIIYTI